MSVTIDAIPVENINIIDSTTYIISNIIDVNDKIMLDTKIYPSNATYQNVEWISSNNDIITLDNQNFKIVGTGKVTLTCCSHDDVSNNITFFIINLAFIKIIFLIIVIFISVIVLIIIRRKMLFKNDNDELESKVIYKSDDNDRSQENKVIAFNVKNDFIKIKDMILNEAKLGHYKIKDGKKCISIVCNCPFLSECINIENKTNINKISYHIGNTRRYNMYLYTIKNFALKYGISIYPFYVMIDDSNNKKIIDLPYEGSGDISNHKIKVFLKCSIQY